jgi:hypothetical protein
MRVGQQVVVRDHSDQHAMNRCHEEMVNPLALHHSPRLQQRTIRRQLCDRRGHQVLCEEGRLVCRG